MTPEFDKHITEIVQAIAYLETQTYHYFKIGDAVKGIKYGTQLAHLARLILA